MSEDGEPKSKKAKRSSSSAADTITGEVSEERKQLLESKVLVKMPEDFYLFWEFCFDRSDGKPAAVLNPCGLRLAGPYDILLNKTCDDDADYLLHSRYFYDIPEFMTVLTGDASTQYHIGYFRDSPSEMPAFLASNEAKKGCKMTPLGDNIFAAVASYITSFGLQKKCAKLYEDLNKCMKKHGLKAGKRTSKIKARDKKIVSRGFHTAGIVVPVDANEVGWREVPRTIGELRKMFTSIVKEDGEAARNGDELQELITYCQFANDEMDYGQGLELGQDLFCFGDKKLHGYVGALLPMAYTLLNFQAFSKIIDAHLQKRTADEPCYLK